MPEMPRCSVCGKTLIQDEIGLTRKLISRAVTEFLCFDCLAAKFRTDVPRLKEMVEYFRSQGCMLFN
ncbi:MAG: hypothetical protein GX827_07105 [Clostridiales bacterium]|jgi:uncharacterized protein YlaI|nr:hypothetical protein [Clostridiales bacterium]